MRKKTLNCFFDNLMWYLIYLMPLIIFVFYNINSGTLTSLGSIFDSIGLNILTDNVVLTTLSDVFGTGGVVPIFTNSDILIYMSYFICVYLVHICVDVLLFIPRLGHKWLNEFTSGGKD